MRTLIVLLLFLVPLLAFHYANVPHAPALALLFGVAVAWVTEIVPIGVTSILIPVVAIVFGLIPPAGAFKEFGSDIVFLIVAVCLLARAFETSNLGQRLAYCVLSTRWCNGSLSRGVHGLTAVSWFFGMWMVNSAVCSILLPIVLGILTVLKPQLEENEYRSFSRRVLFMCSITPGLSGLATPVGAAPNLFAFKYLAEHGQEISFTDWMLLAAPISATLVLLSVLVLDRLHPIPSIDSSRAFARFKDEQAKLGKLTYHEKVVASTFLGVVFLWLIVPNLPKLFPTVPFLKIVKESLSPTVIAMLALVPLFTLGKAKTSLQSKDIQRVDLTTLFLFGGGLTLGGIIESSGLARDSAHLLVGFVQNYPLLSGGAVIMVTLTLSEFCSNTAAVALILPLIISLGGELVGVNQETRLTLLVLFGGTLGFALPAGTVPNGIVYSTGQLTVKDMVATGLWIDLLGAVLIVLALEVVYPLLGLL